MTGVIRCSFFLFSPLMATLDSTMQCIPVPIGTRLQTGSLTDPSHGFMGCSVSICKMTVVPSIYIWNLSLAHIWSRGYTSKCDHILPSRLVLKPDFFKKIIFRVVWCCCNICPSQQCSPASFQPCSHLSSWSQNWGWHSFSESYHDPPAERLIQKTWLERDIWIVYLRHKAWTSVTGFK